MKYLKTRISCSKGFTLVEVIATIVAAGILGVIFIQFMGTAMDSSWNAVEIVRDEAGGEGVMEQIIADYVEAINSSPAGALQAIVDKITNNDYGGNVTWNYIEFNSSGDEINRGAVATDNLKVVLQASGPAAPAITGRYPLTMILTQSRREAEDQKVIFLGRVMITQENGFTLVELIVTIVLVGIIGTFTSLFMYTGLNGYLRAKDTAEGALKAQIALDRISLELRDISQIETLTANAAINYFSTSLPGDRQIIYNAGADTISVDVDGEVNLLLDDVQSFTISAAYRNLNYYADGSNAVEAIDVGFTIGEIGRPFSARIFPRNMVRQPP